jgi:DNA-directed RNA polymerase subunit beta'
MRTFHIGGAAQKTTVQSSAISSYNGDIKFLHKNTVVDSRGKVISMSRNCEAVVVDENKVEKARYKVPYGANLLLNEGDSIKQGDKIAEWDPFTIPIIVEKSGRASFVDLVENVSYSEILDENTGSIINRVSIDSKSHAKGEGFHPRIILHDENSQVMTLANGLEARYFLPVGAILNISDKSWVHAGDVIARIPKESSKSKDITGGLPRVIELVEARQPKDHSIISEIDGYVEYGRDYKSKRRIIIKPIAEGSEPIEYFIPRSRHITIAEGDYVYKGERLMEGSRSPHDILRVMGVQALAEYMIQEVQQVYRLQGVLINDKHIEVILRQMLQKVEVTDAGGTIFLVNEQIDKEEFEEVNIKATKEGYTCANAVPILQGITKASLQTRSFFSAASFQETTRVLTEAAIAGKVDNLSGLKENVIVGRVVPAGTGLYLKKMKKLAHLRDKGMEE